MKRKVCIFSQTNFCFEENGQLKFFNTTNSNTRVIAENIDDVKIINLYGLTNELILNNKLFSREELKPIDCNLVFLSDLYNIKTQQELLDFIYSKKINLRIFQSNNKNYFLVDNQYIFDEDMNGYNFHIYKKDENIFFSINDELFPCKNITNVFLGEDIIYPDLDLTIDYKFKNYSYYLNDVLYSGNVYLSRVCKFNGKIFVFYDKNYIVFEEDVKIYNIGERKFCVLTKNDCFLINFNNFSIEKLEIKNITEWYEIDDNLKLSEVRFEMFNSCLLKKDFCAIKKNDKVFIYETRNNIIKFYKIMSNEEYENSIFCSSNSYFWSYILTENNKILGEIY